MDRADVFLKVLELAVQASPDCSEDPITLAGRMMKLFEKFGFPRGGPGAALPEPRPEIAISESSSAIHVVTEVHASPASMSMPMPYLAPLRPGTPDY